MAMCCTFHISTIFHFEPHFRHSTPYHISYHSTYLIPPDNTSHGVMCRIAWRGIWCDVEGFAMPDVGCCVLFILMWPCCGIRCEVDYVRYGVMLHVMSCNVTEEVLWNVVMRCGMWWCAVMQDVKCGCGIPSDVVWFDAIVMLNDGWNAVWDVWCGGLECVLWDSVMCNLYFSECGDVHGVVWGGMWEWCGMVHRDVVEWLMWIMVRCEMWCDVSVCEMWCDVQCCNFRHGVIEMRDVEYGVVWNVVSWYVACCLMQNVESYDVM